MDLLLELDHLDHHSPIHHLISNKLPTNAAHCIVFFFFFSLNICTIFKSFEMAIVSDLDIIGS